MMLGLSRRVLSLPSATMIRLKSTSARKEFQFSKKIGHSDIEQFAELTGDRNPVHFGPGAIAHGAFLLGLASAAAAGAAPGAVVVRMDGIRFPTACPVPSEVNVKAVLGDPDRKVSDCQLTITDEEEEMPFMFAQCTLRMPSQ